MKYIIANRPTNSIHFLCISLITRYCFCCCSRQIFSEKNFRKLSQTLNSEYKGNFSRHLLWSNWEAQSTEACSEEEKNRKQRSSICKLITFPETGLYKYFLAKIKRKLVLYEGKLKCGKYVMCISRKNLAKLISFAGQKSAVTPMSWKAGS